MKRNRPWSDYAFSVVNYTLLFLMGFATLFPFWNLMAVSLNNALDSLKGGITFFPRQWTFMNYQAIFSEGGLLSAAGLSVLRTVSGTVLSVLCTAMLAYTLSRREFLLRKPFNFILVMTMYINGGLIPFYLLIKNIGLMNHFAVYIIPGLIGVFNVIIMRSYFDQLPDGIVESAKIDGASDFQSLFRIVLPVSLPVLSTITLFVAVGHWNSWFDNYLFASRKESLSLLQYELMKILTQSISQVSQANKHIDSAVLQSNPAAIRAAMTMIVTLPILFIYPFLQRYFVKGMTVGSMKE